MTLIIGIVDPLTKEVYMAADSAGVNGWFQISPRADRKIFEKGGVLFGGAGSYRAIQAVRSKLSIEKPREGEDVYEYVVGEVLEPLRTTLRNAGCLKKENEVETTEGVFMLGYRGRLFTIQSDLQVGETMRNYAALGCAEDIAYGCLHAAAQLVENLPPLARLRMVFDAAVSFSAGVRGPFFYTSESMGRIEELTNEQAAQPAAAQDRLTA